MAFHFPSLAVFAEVSMLELKPNHQTDPKHFIIGFCFPQSFSSRLEKNLLTYLGFKFFFLLRIMPPIKGSTQKRHVGCSGVRYATWGTEDVFSHASEGFSLACHIANCDSAKHPSHLLKMSKMQTYAKTSMDLRTGSLNRGWSIVRFDTVSSCPLHILS